MRTRHLDGKKETFFTTIAQSLCRWPLVDCDRGRLEMACLLCFRVAVYF